MQNRKSWLRVTSVFLPIFNSRLCNFIFRTNFSYIWGSGNTFENTNFTLDCLDVQNWWTSSAQRWPVTWKFPPCQYLKSKPVAENLKQQPTAFLLRKKIIYLHLLRGTVSSKDLNILSSALTVSLPEFGGNSLFPRLYPMLNYFSK